MPVDSGQYTPESIARRRKMAEALMGQSMGGQPIGSHTQGLAQLANALVGGLTMKRADKEEKELSTRTSAKQKQIARALMGGANPANAEATDPMMVQTTPQMLPDRNQAFELAMEPEGQMALEQSPMLGQMLAAQMTPKLERVDLGDRWGLIDSRGEIVRELPKGASPDAELRERGATIRHLEPSGSAALGSETTRRGQDIGANTTTRGQDITAETARRGQDLAAEAARLKAASSASEKLPVLDSMDYVADQLRGALKQVSTGGALGLKGKLSGVIDYQDAKMVDNLAQQLSTELRTLFRIPGEGTLSDREQAQYGLQLPSRDYSPEQNERIITDIQNRARLRLGQPLLGQPGLSERQPSGTGDLSGISDDDLMRLINGQ